jgi:rubrerythrin
MHVATTKSSLKGNPVGHEPNLRDVDVDGAVRETAAEAMDALNGDTRSSFCGAPDWPAAHWSAEARYSVPSAFAFSTGDRPPAKFGAGDIGILNYALTLEYLESTFYNEATANQHRTAFIKDYQTRVFLSAVTQDENQHVAALKKVLGRHAIKKPKFDFHGDNANEARFHKASFTFENEGVHAYSGQAFNIKEPKVLAAALSIVTVEARHASVIGLIRQRSTYGIAPSGAFDKPYGATRVLKDVKSLHYIKG